MKDAGKFYSLAEKWLYRAMERDPVMATQLGEHRWDDRLADRSHDALEAENQDRIQTLDELGTLGLEDFDLDTRIDHTLITRIIESAVRRYERIRSYRRDPGEYINEAMTGVFILIMKEFAPLPDRLRSVLGRVNDLPRLLDNAQANLIPEEVPRVWGETALEQAGRAPGLFLELIPGLARHASPELETGLREAGVKAAAAIRTYSEYLEQAVLPQARGDFAVGTDLFNEMLSQDHMVDYDADGLIETGRGLLSGTENEMEAVAREIDPNRTVGDLLDAAKADHPTAEGLLQAYREAMEAARQYVLDHDIATIPEGESLKIIETPVYLRPLLPYAAYMPPGILEDKQDGLFLVTPVELDASPAEQESRLRGHAYAKLPITALHEAYPGHHLQLVWANRQKTIPRRMASFLSPLFIEGWAFYCEELMEELGYIGEPIQRLGRLKDQLWRAARIILDVSLHTRGMSVEDAVDFLVEKCRLERANAIAEVRRYTGSPTQPQSYLMGKLAIMEIIEDYRRANPGTSLRQMHDAILGCGSLPPRLMRQKLKNRGQA
jgi:uncharacterized protein (DUF885 family)